MKAKTISDLYTEHIDWLTRLDFYQEMLAGMLTQLEEIVSKNTSKNILASAEHFQNQFVVQKENIDKLRHAIHEHEIYLEHEAEKNKTDQQRTNDLPILRETIESFERIFNELRSEFKKFLSVTM